MQPAFRFGLGEVVTFKEWARPPEEGVLLPTPLIVQSQRFEQSEVVSQKSYVLCDLANGREIPACEEDLIGYPQAVVLDTGLFALAVRASIVACKQPEDQPPQPPQETV